MRSKVHICAALLAVVILIAPAFTLTTRSSSGKPVAVSTTSVLASIVKDLAGDKVIVEVIASPSICPAHYGVKPAMSTSLEERT